jgi:hypothetical protein
MILSNNHVIANSNTASLGDPILQPGPYDGGDLEDAIARLYRFVKIGFIDPSECPLSKLWASIYNGFANLFGAKTRLNPVVGGVVNLVDAAIAEPLDRKFVEPGIVDLYPPGNLVEPEVGMTVEKSGRTTCHTVGMIDTVDLTINVMYGYKTALFKDQIGIQPVPDVFSQGGDSGSVVATDRGLVGLLFAGSKEGYTIANKFSHVLNELSIEFY